MNRKTTKKVDESTLTTLCGVCRGAFLDAKGVHLRRADPRQLVKDVCTYCQTRYGFDYYELHKQYGCERYVEMLRIINEAWKGNVDSYASKAEMLRIDMALLVSLALNVLSGNRSE